jgi:hypothetical protein
LHAVTAVAATPPLRLLGYRALAALVVEAAPGQVAPLLPALLPALLQQLAAAEEESLHLALELLEAVIRSASPAANGGTSTLTPAQAMAVAQPVLQVWLRHTSDPLIAPDAQEVIGAIASHPACLPPLCAVAAPTLAGILSRGAANRARKQHQQQHQQQQQRTPAEARAHAAAAAAAAAAGGEVEDSPMLVEASLDLLGALVTPKQPDVAAEVRASRARVCAGSKSAAAHAQRTP